MDSIFPLNKGSFLLVCYFKPAFFYATYRCNWIQCFLNSGPHHKDTALHLTSNFWNWRHRGYWTPESIVWPWVPKRFRRVLRKWIESALAPADCFAMGIGSNSLLPKFVHKTCRCKYYWTSSSTLLDMCEDVFDLRNLEAYPRYWRQLLSQSTLYLAPQLRSYLWYVMLSERNVMWLSSTKALHWH